jgi:cyclin-dependent kinase 8/11
MHDYDPFALDAWSLGCVVAEMFTPIARTPFSHDTAIRLDDLEEDSQSQEGTSLEPFVIVHPETETETDSDSDADADSDVDSHVTVTSRDAQQVEALFTIRQTLFDGSKGDLGLIWSILRVRGTPTSETWPVSEAAIYNPP